jgi:hypothetical protein
MAEKKGIDNRFKEIAKKILETNINFENKHVKFKLDKEGLDLNVRKKDAMQLEAPKGENEK